VFVLNDGPAYGVSGLRDIFDVVTIIVLPALALSVRRAGEGLFSMLFNAHCHFKVVALKCNN